MTTMTCKIFHLRPAVRSLLTATLCLLIAISEASGITATASSTSSTSNGTNESNSPQEVQKRFKLYHSFAQDKPFHPRGTITFSARADTNEITTVIENDESCLSANILQDVDELISNGEFYRIKVVDEENHGQSVLASVPGCEVKRANFREEIALSMSQTGSLLSVSYTPLVSPLAAQCHELDPFTREKEYKFQTLFSYSTATAGMALPKILPKMRPPPGLNAIKQKKNANTSSDNINDSTSSSNTGSGAGAGTNSKFQSEQEEENKKQDANQSFLRKYWYVILPITLMTFFGGEEPQAPQQGSEGAAAAGGTTVSQPNSARSASNTAASGGSSTTTRQRRGKRG